MQLQKLNKNIYVNGKYNDVNTNNINKHINKE